MNTLCNCYLQGEPLDDEQMLGTISTTIDHFSVSHSSIIICWANRIMKICVAVLRRVFQMFDSGKKGTIEMEKVRTILVTMGHNFDDEELEALLEEENKDGSYTQSHFAYTIN